METSFLLGAVVQIRGKNKQAMIVDKGVRYTQYGSSPTGFLCMEKNGYTMPIIYDDIQEIISLGGNPTEYLMPKKDMAEIINEGLKR